MAWAALVLLVASGLAVAVGAAGGPSRRLMPSSQAAFPDWLAGPFGGLFPGGLSDTAFWLLAAGMAVGYLGVIWALRGSGAGAAAGVPGTGERRPAGRAVLAAIVLLHVGFALAPPLLTTDPFGYLAVARAVARGGLDPYAPMDEALAGDPVLPYLVWETRPNPYGPLFTASLAPLAGLGLAAGLWTIKALAAVASLVLVAITALAARSRGRDGVAAAAFVGLNPVLLAWAVGGAHNDLLLMALVVAAVALLGRAREGAGGAVLAAAVAVKASVLLLAPILVAGVRRRHRALAGLAGGLLAAGGLALLVIGPPLAGLPAALADQARLHSPNSVLHVVGWAVGVGGATPAIRAGAAVVLAVTLLALYRRAWRGADAVTTAGWATVAVLVTTGWLMPWYVVWVLPLAALSGSHGLRVAALALCAFVVLMRTPVPIG